MPLPLIPLILFGVSAATGGTGVLAGGNGARKHLAARRELVVAQAVYDAAREETAASSEVTNAKLRALGDRQGEALSCTVVRFAEFIRRNQRKVSTSLKMVADGLDLEVSQCAEHPELNPRVTSILLTMLTAGSTGTAAAAGTTAVVTAVGTASTGTSISALHGAVAQRALLAALGGGAKAVGGGGMALGGTVLNAVTIGPALMVGGLAINGAGEKALTAAREFAMEAAIQTKEVEAYRTILASIEERARELEELLDNLEPRAVAALDALELREGELGGFEPVRDAELFQTALGLSLAVKEVATTPLLDSDGTATTNVAKLKIKYKELLDES